MRYTLEQCVLLYDTYVKYGSARKMRWLKFCDERVPRRQTIHNLMNKLRPTGLFLDKKQKHKRQVLRKKSYPCNTPWKPTGLWEVEAPTSDNCLTDGSEVVSLTHPPPFTPQKDPWYSFLSEAESTPGPLCGWKDQINWKTPWSHRDTFLCVAQCLQQLHYLRKSYNDNDIHLENHWNV
jgi:hypothetical protein